MRPHRWTDWAAIFLLAAFGVLGLRGGVDELDGARTLGQRVATATEFGYGLCGVLAAFALWRRLRWARLALLGFAVTVTLTSALAPVVWGGATLGAGAAAAVFGALIAAGVWWLATRSRAV